MSHSAWALIVGGPGRTSSPAFDAAEELMSMDAWGALFFLAGLGCALVPHLRAWRPAPIVLSASLASFWAATLTSPAPSCTGGLSWCT